MPSGTMRGVMYLGPGQLELRRVPIPTPGPDDILVRIRAALTCGTDVKTYRRGHPEILPPTIFGHELAGDVVEVGARVTQFAPGMRVVAHNSAPCGKCYECKHGQPNLCEHILFNFGAFAEYIVIPGPIVELNTFELPTHLSYAQAAVMEPLGSVVHGQAVIQIQPGETVAIIGAGGPIGLMHLQMALRRGATQVIAVDMKPERLAVAKQLGATHIINAAQRDPVQAIRDITGGRGADVAIESAGALEAWQTAVQVVRKGGRVLWFGGLAHGLEITLDTHWVHYGELALHGVHHCTPLDVLNAFQLISSGVINTQALISGELPLEGVEEALHMMMDGRCIKMAIIPN